MTKKEIEQIEKLARNDDDHAVVTETKFIKKTYDVSLTLHDLIKCLADYAEHLEVLPEDSDIIPTDERKSQTYRFIINSKEDRVNAIMDLLFGVTEEDKEPRKKRGNKGFRDNDKAELRNLRIQLEGLYKTKKEFLKLCAEEVQIRNAETMKEESDSIVRRLSEVYKELEQEGWDIPQSIPPQSDDYSAFKKTGFENFLVDDLDIVLPWLRQYKEEILKHLLPPIENKK